jgi:hypothetical protein
MSTLDDCIDFAPAKDSSSLAEIGTQIDYKENRHVLAKIYTLFEDNIVDKLEKIPIIKILDARTALAHTSRFFESEDDFHYIGVSRDWDNAAKESRFWQRHYSKPGYNMGPNDPCFSDDFKLDLLIHEFLHLIQDTHIQDMELFYKEVKKWYKDESKGIPSPSGIYAGKNDGTSRLKYTLWWNLYREPDDPEEPKNDNWKNMSYNDGYKNSQKGQEEFAYIGACLLQHALNFKGIDREKDILLELPESIIKFYRGIIKKEFLTKSS